jgi:D-inositol-3-phosphate glycosyltransferase
MLEKRIGVVMYQTSHSKGQELVAQRMVRDFNELGYKAYLITSIFHDGEEVIPAGNFKKGKGHLLSEDNALKIPVIRVDSSVAQWPPRRIIFRDFIHTLEGIVDEFRLNVLITHSTLWNGPEEVAKFITWRRQMRDRGGYHDPIVFCHMSHFQEPSPQRYSLPELTFRTAWNKLSLSKILETANLVLVVTPRERQLQQRMGAKREQCFLFPGGIDDRTFLQYSTRNPAEFLKRLNIQPGTRIISYLGTIEERKNPLAVLKVARKLKDRHDIHFILAGRSDSTYAREVEKIARSLPNVSYLGEIDDKDKISLIKSSHINILMSKLEALGIVQLEFMYGGVPVITSASGGQSWVVQDGVEGLHLKGPEDIDGAAMAILCLIEDDKKYRQMSIDARQKAGKFTISRLIRELDEVLDGELIKESKLNNIPREVRETLARPEYALKCWSAGTRRVVATNRRIYIKHGIISKAVTELRYLDIKAIKYLKRYPWKVLLVGAAVSVFTLFAPGLRPFLSRALGDQIAELVNIAARSDLIQLLLTNNLGFLLPGLPFLISIFVFLAGIQSYFSLHTAGMKPVYLPGKFKEVIRYIRDFEDSPYNVSGEVQAIATGSPSGAHSVGPNISVL